MNIPLQQLVYGPAFPEGWYMVMPSKQLQDKPTRIRAFGEDIVLFRPQPNQEHVNRHALVQDVIDYTKSRGAKLGLRVAPQSYETPVALELYCPHMGARLDNGRIVGDRLRCFNHAWEFDTRGRCVEAPGTPEHKIPKSAHRRAWPIREFLDWIWIYNGDTINIPFPDIPVPARHDWLRHDITGKHMPVHIAQTLENPLDGPHLNPVHGLGCTFKGEVKKSTDTEFVWVLTQGYPKHFTVSEFHYRGASFSSRIAFVPNDKADNYDFAECELVRTVYAPLPIDAGNMLMNTIAFFKKPNVFFNKPHYVALQPLYYGAMVALLYNDVRKDMRMWVNQRLDRNFVMVASDRYQHLYRKMYAGMIRRSDPETPKESEDNAAPKLSAPETLLGGDQHLENSGQLRSP